jgi:TDG/mug DNA glycosylase family protein
VARYLVPDLLAPGLELVFCGTAPSRASAAARAYYARPGNRFWRALHEAGLTPRRLHPSEYRELLGLGIGLTDLCKEHSGNDDELPADALDAARLRRKLRHYRPGIVAFTSKNAARAFLGRDVDYGWQPERVGDTRLMVLPSPSGQATRFWSLGPWAELAQAISCRDRYSARSSSGSCS